MNSQQVQLKKNSQTRRLRRNMDVVVNALNKIRSTSNPANNTVGASAIKEANQQQNPYSRQQFFNRAKLTGGINTHSQSQHVLENSQAIQNKINMYANQHLQQSPQPSHGTKTSTAKLGPPALQQNMSQQRMGMTPQPGNPGNTYPPMLPNSQYQPQIQLQQPYPQYQNQAQNKRTKNTSIERQKNSTYYDQALAGARNGSKMQHHSSTQNLDQRPRASSQLAAQVSGRGQSKNTRNINPTSLNSRQTATTNLANHTLYSQISLKEIPTPVKQYKLASKVSVAKAIAYAKQNQSGVSKQQYSQKYLPQSQQNLFNLNQHHNNTQPLQQYLQQASHTVSEAQLQNQRNPSAAELEQMVVMNQPRTVQDGLILNVPPQMGNQPPNEALSDNNHSTMSNNSKSRNLNALHSGESQTNNNQPGQILNINTASDINIYNNQFIVNTSPRSSNNPQTKNSGRATQAQGVNKKVNKISGNNLSNTQNGGQRGSRAGSNKALNDRNQAQSVLNSTGQPQNLNQPLRQDNQQARSVSQGRGQKILSNQRMQDNQRQQKQPQKGNGNNRAQAINEAYNQNPAYLINNQVLQQAALPVPQMQPSHQNLSSWRAQQLKLNNQHKNTNGNKKPPTLIKNRQNQSHENIQYRTEDQRGMYTNAATSLKGPQYNNLVAESQKFLAATTTEFQHSQSVSQNARQFKKVKKEREAYNTQLVNDKMGSRNGLSQLMTDVKSVNDSIRDLISKGRLKIQQRNYIEAIKLFTEVLESFDPNDQEAIFYRAISYLDQGNLQQAISELWRVVSPSTTPTISDRGETRKVKNDKMKNKLVNDQLAQQAYILLSIAHKRLGETQNAVQDLEMCIESYPQYPDAYLAKGQNLLLNEEFDLALQDFQQYIKLKNEESFTGQLGIGDCLKALKQYRQAIEAYSKAISLLPSQKNKANYRQINLQCHQKRGLASYHDGQFQQALSDFQSVIRQDNSDVKAHFYIGKLLTKGVENNESKQTDAILHFEQVAKYPEHEFYAGNALFQIAKIRLKQKDYYEAFYSLKRASDNNFASKRMDLYRNFTEGVLYLIKRKIKKGVQILSDLLEVLVNKDKEGKKKGEEESKKSVTMKAHSDYLIHQILVYRAYGYVAIEKYEMAHEDIRRVKKYDRIDPATIYNKWLGKGILRMDHEDYLMASKFFTKAWKKFPQNKDPYCLQVISVVRSYSYSLGGYWVDQSIKFDKVMETKKFMDKAITNCDKKQKEPSLYFFRGLLNFQMHRFYDALQDFNTAIDEEEESTAYFFLARGRCYACLSILTEAMKDLSIALNLDETIQQGYIYRGKCAYLIGDNNLAFLDFQRLILTDPKNPMVHVYAGNLLMTTGAYTDAIKAFENADTVEPTSISAFQRVRCFCAISELHKAQQMMDIALKAMPNDVILKFDCLCLDQLVNVSETTRKMAQGNLTSATIKNSNQIYSQAIATLDELLQTYESDALSKLKKKDSMLNIQLIPNVERIKIEKVLVAKDFNLARQALPEEQKAEIPSLSVDLDEPHDPALLQKLQEVSYYYENIFNLEDFYLYRGVFKYYSQDYNGAIIDFQAAQRTYREFSGQNGEMRSNRISGLNTRNQSLQQYTAQSPGASIGSNKTDLSDIGLCSFNSNECIFNQFLCYFLLNDQDHCIQKLNDLSTRIPKRYSKNILLLRVIVLETFGKTDKAQEEIKKLKQVDLETYQKAFKGGTPYLIELFPSSGRLCEKFQPTTIRLPTNSQLNKLSQTGTVAFQIRLSFSMPFIKPPNMIPNVDEDVVQGEFNLKQIDAPMPEAPWVKRCAHGITFTNNILQENASAEEQEKFKKFFDTAHNPAAKQTGRSASETAPKEKAKKQRQVENDTTSILSAGTRLLDNMVGQNVSDRDNLSLMDEESKISDEDCEVVNCTSKGDLASKPRTNIHTKKNSMLKAGELSESNAEQDGELDLDSYDSEDILDEGDGADAMELENLNRESLVNMGENVTRDNLRQMRKMKQEMQPAVENVQSETVKQLLPNQEEQKALMGAAPVKQQMRYLEAQDDTEEMLHRHVDSSTSEAMKMNPQRVSQQLLSQAEREPHGLNEKMLAGIHKKHKRKRERRVSNLSIGSMSKEEEQIEVNSEEKQGKDGGNKVDDTQERRKVRRSQRSSMFKSRELH